MFLAQATFARILLSAEHWKQVMRKIRAAQGYHFVVHVRKFIKSSLIGYNIASFMCILFGTINL